MAVIMVENKQITKPCRRMATWLLGQRCNWTSWVQPWQIHSILLLVISMVVDTSSGAFCKSKRTFLMIKYEMLFRSLIDPEYFPSQVGSLKQSALIPHFVPNHKQTVISGAKFVSFCKFHTSQITVG